MSDTQKVTVDSGKMLVIESSRGASVSEQWRGRRSPGIESNVRWIIGEAINKTDDVRIVLLPRRRRPGRIIVGLRTEGGEITGSSSG